MLVYLFAGMFLFSALGGLLSSVLRFAIDPAAPPGGAICPAWIGWFAGLELRWTRECPEGNIALPIELSLRKGRESVVFRSRMLADRVRRTVRWSDPTGLFVWSLSGMIPGPVRHDPARRQGLLPRAFFDGSEGEIESPDGKVAGDLTDSRSYRAGDSVRRILWGAVAKQGGLARAGNRLMVRSEERVISRRISVFFLPGCDDEAAAGFTRSCLEAGLLGEDWVFSTTGLSHPIGRASGTVERCLEAIDRTASPAPEWSHSLSELKAFAGEVRKSGIQTLFVMAGARFLLEDPARERLILSYDRGIRILAIVSDKDPTFSSPSPRTRIVQAEVAA